MQPVCLVRVLRASMQSATNPEVLHEVARVRLAGSIGNGHLPLAACQTEKPLPQQRFDLRGKVVAVDKNAGTVTLAHEAIPVTWPP